MKNKTNIILTVAAAVVIITITACDVLVSPIKERNNPNDPENPVPAVEMFNVGIEFSETGERFIPLNWTEGTSNTEIKLEGYIIMRKTGSVPESIWDGTFVVMWPKEDGQAYDDYVAHNEGYPVGKKVYYSIFSYGPKWDDISDEERLGTDENGRLFNYENYQFTGPVSRSIDVWDSIELPVTVDKYMIPDNTVIDNNLLVVITNASIAESVCGIKFDLASSPMNVNIEKAQLALAKRGTSVDGSMRIAAWGGEWVDVTSWTTLFDIPVNNEFTISVPTGEADILTADVTEIYLNWHEGNNNFGFSLRSDDGENNIQFAASEEGADGPKLRVWFWSE